MNTVVGKPEKLIDTNTITISGVDFKYGECSATTIKSMYTDTEPDGAGDDDDDTLYGFIDVGEQSIYVNNSVGIHIMCATVLHEILHGILVTKGFLDVYDDENLVTALSYGLLDVLKTNPALLKSLAKILCPAT